MSILKTCKRCILDSSVHDIWFNEKGECKYCMMHDEMEKHHPLNEHLTKNLQKITERIKQTGKGKKYDCIAGVSGGRDSSYTLLKAVQLGLRPLAVHFDNGWNSNISVSNIKKACDKLNVELYTVVADWDEFRDLQISFLKASTPDADIPTDYAIYSVLYSTANKEGIKYILNGHSFRTEGTSPISWSYMDPLYVKNVHKRYGQLKRIRSFPHMTISKLLWYIFVKKIKEVRLLEYIDYQQKDVDQVLHTELGWEYYGGHHHENSYTKFFQSFLLPKKFNIDKRKTELSALIRSGQISKEEAMNELNSNPYKYDDEVVDYTLKKLSLKKEEFDNILQLPVKSHDDYKTLLPLIRFFKLPVRIACKFHLLPHILYLKYAK